jgi:phosphonoacetaldehyde hydrolase
MDTPAEDRIGLVVFDWAGTLVDYGSFAPVVALQRVFARRGIRVISAHAREPMGRSKREHIAAVLRMPEIDLQWQKVLGRTASRADIESIYRDFQITLLAVLESHSQLTPGALDVLDDLRARGTRVATTTGYFRQAADQVLAAAEKQGFVPDHAVCSDDVSVGRPAPWMIYACMETLQVFPPGRVVVVGDTVADVQAARNAGCYSVAVSRTGNEVGLSEAEWAALDAQEQEAHLVRARAALREAGAHVVIETLSELPAVIERIELRSRPGGALLHAASEAVSRFVRSHVRSPHGTIGVDS